MKLAAMALAAALMGVSALASQQAPTVEELLDRATTYVEDFLTKFSGIVAEERYIQEYLTVAVEGSRGSFQGTPQVRDRRTLVSDLLLVRAPESQVLYVFRDVFEVNG